MSMKGMALLSLGVFGASLSSRRGRVPNPQEGPGARILRRRPLTAQGHARSIFQRAIENGNLLVAEMTARELGRITLHEALLLTALVADQDPERRSRFTVRWLRRLLEEDETLTIEEAAMATSCMAALGGQSHDEALGMLSAMAEKASRPRRMAM
jgi:hypothetical protein